LHWCAHAAGLEALLGRRAGLPTTAWRASVSAGSACAASTTSARRARWSPRGATSCDRIDQDFFTPSQPCFPGPVYTPTVCAKGMTDQARENRPQSRGSTAKEPDEMRAARCVFCYPIRPLHHRPNIGCGWRRYPGRTQSSITAHRPIRVSQGAPHADWIGRRHAGTSPTNRRCAQGRSRG
jgi:hypothetical protein